VPEVTAMGSGLLDLLFVGAILLVLLLLRGDCGT
jgi:hypothetical protein